MLTKETVVDLVQAVGHRYLDGVWTFYTNQFEKLAELVAQAAEQVEQGYLSELKALRQERDDAYAKADDLEARLVAMSEALQMFVEGMDTDVGDSQDWWVFTEEKIRQALSAAPKVLLRLSMMLGKVPGGYRILVPDDEELGLMGLEYEEAFDVLVLESDPLPDAERATSTEEEQG
jgi:hypothetical protein